MPARYLWFVLLTGCLSSAMVRTSSPDEGRLRIRYEVCGGAHGALVTHVEPGLAADRAGLREGDVIETIASAPIGYDEVSVEQALARFHPGDRIEVTYRRAAAAHQVVAELDPPPATTMTADGVKLGGCAWAATPAR